MVTENFAFGPDDPSVAQVLNRLGTFYRAHKKLDLAMPILLRDRGSHALEGDLPQDPALTRALCPSPANRPQDAHLVSVVSRIGGRVVVHYAHTESA